MSRFSRYDTDEERLPSGMTRVGYDADTQVYTFQDSDGSLWESAPGCQYGQLTRVSSGYGDLEAGAGHADDTEPFLVADDTRLPEHQRTSWRHDMMPLLNFGVIVGVCLLLLFWYLHWMAKPSGEELMPACGKGGITYAIKQGDTCWDIAETRRVRVEDILAVNDSLDCEKLVVGETICLPKPVG